MLGDCHCADSGLGHGVMITSDIPAFLENDPDPGTAEDTFPYDYFMLGTEGLGRLGDLPGFSFSPGIDMGGGDGSGGGGFTFPVSLPAVGGGYSDCPVSMGTDPTTGDVCIGPDAGPVGSPVPSGGGGGAGGPGINWGSIISNLINTAGGVARMAVGSPQYPGGRIVGYSQTGQPIYGGVSGGVSLGPGGITGSAGISTNTLIIGGLVLAVFLLGGKR
jgi:hypothetical protein